MPWPTAGKLTSPLFSTKAMSAVFSDAGRIQAMLDVEAGLARAEAACGVIPAQMADPIAAACKAELFDLAQLGRLAVSSGNLAVPLVLELTQKIEADTAEAARWVHWGATSQDIVDTGLVLQIRAAMPILEDILTALCGVLARIADTHAETPMTGRTLLQQAVPTTLGLKAAGWLTAISEAEARLSAAGSEAQMLQFGGAAGTLSALQGEGLAVAAALAAELALPLPPLPWHSQRGRIADLGCALALLLGTLGKLARDLALMAQTEIGEFHEPGDGRGGSSAMPNKANPVGCARILAAAKRAPHLAATLLAAMDQEHERGLGGWHAEWEVLPELFRLTAMAAEAALDLTRSGIFDTARMRANLDASGGFVMAETVAVALAARIGRSAAHALVGAAARRAKDERLSFADALAAHAGIAQHLEPGDLVRLLDPLNALGAAPEMTRRAIRHYHSRKT